MTYDSPGFRPEIVYAVAVPANTPELRPSALLGDHDMTNFSGVCSGCSRLKFSTVQLSAMDELDGLARNPGPLDVGSSSSLGAIDGSSRDLTNSEAPIYKLRNVAKILSASLSYLSHHPHFKKDRAGPFRHQFRQGIERRRISARFRRRGINVVLIHYQDKRFQICQPLPAIP